MLVELNNLIDGYHQAYDNYMILLMLINKFLNYFTNVVSSFYMDFTKDILYIEKAWFYVVDKCKHIILSC